MAAEKSAQTQEKAAPAHTGTREEVSLLFGTNQTLYTGRREVTVKVNNRIAGSPYAAKRLQALLGEVVKQYESRFGQLNIGAAE